MFLNRRPVDWRGPKKSTVATVRVIGNGVGFIAPGSLKRQGWAKQKCYYVVGFRRVSRPKHGTKVATIYKLLSVSTQSQDV